MLTQNNKQMKSQSWQTAVCFLWSADRMAVSYNQLSHVSAWPDDKEKPDTLPSPFVGHVSSFALFRWSKIKFGRIVFSLQSTVLLTSLGAVDVQSVFVTLSVQTFYIYTTLKVCKPLKYAYKSSNCTIKALVYMIEWLLVS